MREAHTIDPGLHVQSLVCLIAQIRGQCSLDLGLFGEGTHKLHVSVGVEHGSPRPYADGRGALQPGSGFSMGDNVVVVETDPTGELRKRVRALRLTPPPRATSVDGRTFEYEVPVDRTIPLGSFVSLGADGSGEYLGQIVSGELAMRSGPSLHLDRQELQDRFPEAHLGGATVAVEIRTVRGEGALLGRLERDRILSPGAGDVFEDAAITTASDAIVEGHLRGLDPDSALLEVGRARDGHQRFPALIRAAGFNRHTFLCGQSGSGKTFALGVLMERLLIETSLPLIVIDPNGDYVRLGEARDLKGEPDGGAPGADAVARYRQAVADVRVLRAKPSEGERALRMRFRDLGHEGQAAALRLDPLRDREEYNDLVYVNEARPGEGWPSFEEPLRVLAERDPHRAELLRMRIQNLGIPSLSVWGTEPAAMQAIAELPRGLVLDLGGFELPVERSAVALAVLRRLWADREQRRPVLVVIDEAHNVCPREPEDELQTLVVQELVRIAGEGRKYGLHLLLATQRPAKIHPNVLSQCDNLVLMRMNSSADLAHVASGFSFAPEPLVGLAAGFRKGEALIAGAIAPSPLVMRFEGRFSPEGGGDLPTTWAARDG